MTPVGRDKLDSMLSLIKIVLGNIAEIWGIWERSTMICCQVSISVLKYMHFVGNIFMLVCTYFYAINEVLKMV